MVWAGGQHNNSFKQILQHGENDNITRPGSGSVIRCAILVFHLLLANRFSQILR